MITKIFYGFLFVSLQLLLLNIILPPLLLNVNYVANALPITSKPIESTAENLAWQAWLMLPPEQKSQEKSRKVTPKSIFTLPFRDCPQGQHLFEDRCIHTVNIDPTALLTQQLLGFISNGGENTDYDYDETAADVYEPPQKLSDTISGGIVGGLDGISVIDSGLGTSGYGNYDDASQLPSKDEPLKFNIFQQNIPMFDYEAADMPVSSIPPAQPITPQNPPVVPEYGKPTENHTNPIFNNSQFLELMKGFLERHANVTWAEDTNIHKISNTNAAVNTNTTATQNLTSPPPKNIIPDLQSESSNISTKFVPNIKIAPPPSIDDDVVAEAVQQKGEIEVKNENTNEKIVENSNVNIWDAPQQHKFSIDAIVLPAATTATNPITVTDLEPKRQQKFPLFKDASAVQLVTTVMKQQQKQHQQEQLQMEEWHDKDRHNTNNFSGNNKDDTSKRTDTSAGVKDSAEDLFTIKSATTTTTTTTTGEKASQLETTQFFNTDSLLPLFNLSERKEEKNGGKIPAIFMSKQEKTTITPPSDEDEEEEEEESTTMLPSIIMDDSEGMTTTTTLPKNFDELLDAVETAHESMDSALVSDDNKDEHTRSITELPGILTKIIDENQAQELDFTTTQEPDGTTNFQLDETTIIEEHNPPTIAQLERKYERKQQQQQQQHQAQQEDQDQWKNQQISNKRNYNVNPHFVLKKSKVKPVDVVPKETATTQLPSIAVKQTETATTMKTIASEKVSASTSSPLLTTTTTAENHNDRFDYHQHSKNEPSSTGSGSTTISTEVDHNDVEGVGNVKKSVGVTSVIIDDVGSGKQQNVDAESTSSTTTSTTRSSATMSEINIEKELRIINELVKGKRQPAATKFAENNKQTETTTTTTTTTTESGFTAELIENKNSANVKNVEIETEKVEGEMDIPQIVAAVMPSSEPELSLITTSTTSISASKHKEEKDSTTQTVDNVDIAVDLESADNDDMNYEEVDVHDNDARTETTTTTTSENNGESLTSTIWAKIMPFFGYSTTTTTATDELALGDEPAKEDELEQPPELKIDDSIETVVPEAASTSISVSSIEDSSTISNTNSESTINSEILSSNLPTPTSSLSDDSSSLASPSPFALSLSSSSTETPTTTSISSKESSSSTSSSYNNNFNRSNRNSKIIRINNLNSLNSVDSPTTKTSHNNKKNSLSQTTTTTTTSIPIPIPLITESKAVVVPSTESTTITTTTIMDSSTNPTIVDNSNVENSSTLEPFWWLPRGWRLDCSSTVDERPLLLRFWSAFPGVVQTKVKN